MEREQRFSLAISLQNLKENKCIVLIILGLLSLVGLYLGYPVFVVKETNHVTEQLSFFKSLVQPSLNTFNVTDEDVPQTGKLIKWGFDSVTPSSCSEDHVIDLGMNIYLTVCNFKSNIVIDIRKFTGNSRVGITPTILGIGLNVAQWEILTKYISIIDKYISELS